MFPLTVKILAVHIMSLGGQFWGKKDTSFWRKASLWHVRVLVWKNRVQSSEKKKHLADPIEPSMKNGSKKYLDLLNLVGKKHNILQVGAKCWFSMIYHGIYKPKFKAQRFQTNLEPTPIFVTQFPCPRKPGRSVRNSAFLAKLSTPGSLVISRNSSYDYRYGYFPTFPSNNSTRWARTSSK